MPPLLALGALLLLPGVRAEPATWDGRQQRGTTVVMPVFAALPLAEPELGEAVEGFLGALRVRRDVDAALTYFSDSVDDACFLPVSLSISDTAECRRGTPLPVSPEKRRAWRRERVAALIRFAARETPAVDASSLAVFYRRLSIDAGFARELYSEECGDRVETLGRLFLVSRPFRARSMSTGGFFPDSSGEGALKAVRRRGLDVRKVYAAHRSEYEGALGVDAMFWVREPGGWKLWSVNTDYSYERNPYTGEPRRPVTRETCH